MLLSSVDIRSKEHIAQMHEEQLAYKAAVLENTRDIVITTDLNFQVVSWNCVAADFFMVTEANAIGKLITDIFRFEYGRQESSVLEQFLRQGFWQGDVSYSRKDGHRHYLKHTVSFLHDGQGRKSGVLFMANDISTEKHAEEKVQNSEKFYRSLIAESLDGILLMDVNGLVTFASPSLKHILGYDPEEVMGVSAFDYVHPEELELAIQSLALEASDSSERKFIVVRLLTKSGEWLWCNIRAHNLLSNPYVQGVAIYFHDDTPRQIAIEALQESKERFRNLIRDLQTGVMVIDREGSVTMSNNAMYRMLAMNEEDILERNILDLYPGSIREDGTQYGPHERPAYLAFQEKRNIRDHVMGIWNNEEERHLWLMVNADPIFDTNGDVHTVVCSFVDISERKKLEQKLLSDQLAHQRQLTQASIDSQEKERREIGKELHDNIGQQLTTIKLFLDLAKSTADESTAEMISLSLRNVSDVINEIRGLCRSLIPSSLGDLGLIDCINDLVTGITRTRKLAIETDHSEFMEEIVPENKKLMLFRILQEQLNNIVKHAEATRVNIQLRQADGFIFMEVTDDGKGFDPLVIRRGLGLTNMRNRAELFGGSAILQTAPGKGVTLFVKVPEFTQETNS